MASGERFIVLTGGSGTGKTTTISHILKSVDEVNLLMGTSLRIAPTATTNQAAEVLTKIVRKSIPTIYSLLGLYPRGGKIHSKQVSGNYDSESLKDEISKAFNRDTPPNAYILIDEYSYVSEELLYWLLHSTSNCGFIFVGDEDQLLSPQIKGQYSPVNMLDPKIYRLTEQHRTYSLEDGTNPIKDLYTRFKNAIHTGETIDDISLAPNIHLISDEKEFTDSIGRFSRVIAYTNRRVNELSEFTHNAGTVHKAQGDTSDRVFMDLSDMVKCIKYDSISTFNRLMYVGISRARKELVIYYDNREY